MSFKQGNKRGSDIRRSDYIFRGDVKPNHNAIPVDEADTAQAASDAGKVHFGSTLRTAVDFLPELANEWIWAIRPCRRGYARLVDRKHAPSTDRLAFLEPRSRFEPFRANLDEDLIVGICRVRPQQFALVR